jgi:hypothetical protein
MRKSHQEKDIDIYPDDGASSRLYIQQRAFSAGLL